MRSPLTSFSVFFLVFFIISFADAVPVTQGKQQNSTTDHKDQQKQDSTDKLGVKLTCEMVMCIPEGQRQDQTTFHD